MMRPPRCPALLGVAALGLIVYAAVQPLRDWQWSGFGVVPGSGGPDAANAWLLFAAFGAAIASGFERGRRALVVASAAGLMLGVTVECAQAGLPHFVPALRDLFINVAAVVGGAAVALALRPGASLGSALHAWRGRHCRVDFEANLALGVLALWTAAHVLPGIPRFSLTSFAEGYGGLWRTVTQAVAFDIRAALIAACATLGIAPVAYRVWPPRRGRMLKTVLVIFAVLLLEGAIATRQTSFEALLGTIVGLALFRFLSQLEILAARSIGFVALIVMLFLMGWDVPPGSTGSIHPFNWVPLHGPAPTHALDAAALAARVWPYAALALLLIAQWRAQRRWLAPIGLVAVGVIAFIIEWRQQYLPARLGDITDVLLAVAAFVWPWLLLPPLSLAEKRRRPSRSKAFGYGRPKRRSRRSRHPLLPAAIALLLALAVGTWLALYNPPVAEVVPDETQLLRLPEGKALPAVQFQHFRSEHPRLPAPSAAELARLRAENPEWLALQAKRASGREPDLEAMVLMALVDPASIDLAALHRRLLALKFVYRGNEQTKPLAKAYDWLYARWTPAQRDTLLRKTLDGCESQIAVIRDQRLSPYNVYLYNSPLQALMACALATYGEAPRADAVMRFTQDYWLNRVLPVWRQVMGQHGGWHEGGEYVGIGIGQAVYQLPAIWRTATGEDFFASEPGLRGFLDFLVQRQRPDGTYFRWGDAGYFDRDAPDRVPLAIEYRHAAAYSLGGCPKRVEPTAWPWGPLTDPTLCDETAAAKLELSTLFDGIGMLIARSDWGSDGTHVSFKAGNNYWSHSHLDQGAFTIFKRFPLAIDSGVYGTRYGSDHHMNYTYQTVAHNALTVTDPEDIVQAPSKDGARYIANDGGQRRIGSGWGMEPAPIDYDEWMLKSDIYRAGKILEYEHTAVFDSIVADLTAAYTNPASGKGLFSPRTRRVNSYQRSFAYDRDFDAVVIYDRVAIEQPHFHVRWLLHTVAKPAKGHHSFDVTVESKPNEVQRGRAGLRGYVPVPLDHHINLVGGPGYEFFVDGRNYDENGEVQREVTRKRLTEAGEWRIEIEPGEQGFKHEFLVLLLPWVDAPPADLDVRCSSEDKYHLCTLTRAGRETSYRVLRDSGRIERVTDVTARIEE
ncbi:MAG TPA: heparinase II/III family protein [Gammaproteobacteria bacterium]|nr:heparinase II/III family protein [Gammaproteobacteria bacterium]